MAEFLLKNSFSCWWIWRKSTTPPLEIYSSNFSLCIPCLTFSTLTKLSFITFILEQYTMYSQKYTFLHGPLLTNGSYWMQAECANALLCLNVEEILSKCLFLHKKSIRESLLLCIYIIILLWYNFLVLQMQINVIYVVDSLHFIVGPFLVKNINNPLLFLQHKIRAQSFSSTSFKSDLC